MTPLTHRERRAAGVLARKHCSRRELGTVHAGQWADDPLGILSRSMDGRLPALVPIKYQRMAASAFGFFRGAASIMAADLATHPNTGVLTQLCGDAHVANLGAYAAQDGALVFDLNDFDETTQGPFEWDVKRFATSLLLAGREAHIRRDDRHAAVEVFTGSYRTAMQEFAAMPVVELARFQIRRIEHLAPIQTIFRMAERSTPQRLLDKLTTPDKNDAQKRQFRLMPPLQQGVPAEQREHILAGLQQYSLTLPPERRHFFAQYRPKDVMLRVVGTGSVGLRSYVVYLEGASRRPGTDPLFLQVKEEPASAYAAVLPQAAESVHNQGERVMNGQRMMQLVSDPFLGFTTIEGRDYLVRQYHDHKASLDLSTVDAPTLRGYAILCGEILARGHARGGDPAAIAAYVGAGDRFGDAILRFARAYARKTRDDWQTLCKSLHTGDEARGTGGATSADGSK